jgi:serine/threonine-protein kinase PRP4
MASPASSDEGEIRDGNGNAEKATKSLPQYDGTSVDRPDRNRSSTSASRSPEHTQRSRDRRSRDRSQSPYSDRQPRGFKRGRDDEPHDRSRRDPRTFHVRYEEGSQEYTRRSRVSYEDLDQGKPSSSTLQYDDRDRRSDKRPRTRSRSPYRAARIEDRSNRGGQSRRDDHRSGGYSRGFEKETRRPNSQLNGESRGWERKDQSVSKRGTSPLPADNARHEAKFTQGYSQQHKNHSTSNDEISKYVILLDKNVLDTDILDRSSLVVDAPIEEPVDEAALIEQRRKRREAIKAKYRGSGTPLLVQALQLADKSGQSTPGHDTTPSTSSSKQNSTEACRHADRSNVAPLMDFTPSPPAEVQEIGSPATFDIIDDQDLANTNGNTSKGDDNDGPSAADYDPTMDMREDKKRDDQRHNEEISSGVYDETKPTTEQDILLPSDQAIPTIEVKPIKAKDDFDMFADDDDDDMFADDYIPNGKPQVETSDHVAKAVPIPQARELDIGMLDNWDDPEGYYKVILGELLNGRYHVQSNLGKGMFSGVVRAEDAITKKAVAIKLIRNNDTMSVLFYSYRYYFY